MKWATIEVVVVEDSKTSEACVVMHNLQRVKTQEEIINESQYYLSLFPPEQGKRNDLDPKAVDENATPKDKKKVTRFDKAAELLDHSVSASTVRRIDNVIQATKQAKADGLKELLDMKIEEKMRSGEYTPASAENLIKNYHKFAKERAEEKGIGGQRRHLSPSRD